MGCNYYLKYKGDLTVDEHNSLTDYLENITKLENGYVYRNRYYESLPQDFYHLLHIGKSSCGWHFSLCIYPSLCINSLDDWKMLFDKYEIINEYDEIISKEEMIKCVTQRSREEVLSKEEIEEFCRRNFAEVGLNNLFAHSSSPYSVYKRTNGTYDITEDWDFS